VALLWPLAFHVIGAFAYLYASPIVLGSYHARRRIGERHDGGIILSVALRWRNRQRLVGALL